MIVANEESIAMQAIDVGRPRNIQAVLSQEWLFQEVSAAQWTCFDSVLIEIRLEFDARLVILDAEGKTKATVAFALVVQFKSIVETAYVEKSSQVFSSLFVVGVQSVELRKTEHSV